MGNYTRGRNIQMWLKTLRFIRLQFTDMFRTLKNIAITARELPRALDNRYHRRWIPLLQESQENPSRICT